MKKIQISLLMLIMFSMSACSMFSSNDTTSQDSVEKEDVVEESKDNTTESISNIFTHFDDNNIEYTEKEKIENMDFAAEEGYSFRFDNEYVYLYRLDDTDSMMQQVLDEANNRGILTATQNGVDQDYKALVNGNYIMIYNQDATIEDLETKFNEYK